jgi:hypothetical protein
MQWKKSLGAYKQTTGSSAPPVATRRLPSRPYEETGAESQIGIVLKEKQGSGAPLLVKLVPYPDRLKTTKPDVSKFMEIFKKLQVNIPFADMVEQVPRYARYLKDILAKKRKLPHGEQVAMTEQCSVVLTRKLPKKEKDPGNFSLKCGIGKEKLRGLCDLGASINLMPLSIFKRLKIGQMRHMEIFLIIVDKSEVKPVGVVENVLVKVEHLLFPVDFVVIDVKEDSIPLILGRPFLYTSRAIIDVFKGHLTLEMGDEGLLVRMFEQDKEIQEGESMEESSPRDLDDDEFFDDEDESFASMMHKRKKEYWESGERLQGRIWDT